MNEPIIQPNLFWYCFSIERTKGIMHQRIGTEAELSDAESLEAFITDYLGILDAGHKIIKKYSSEADCDADYEQQKRYAGAIINKLRNGNRNTRAKAPDYHLEKVT